MLRGFGFCVPLSLNGWELELGGVVAQKSEQKRWRSKESASSPTSGKMIHTLLFFHQPTATVLPLRNIRNI